MRRFSDDSTAHHCTLVNFECVLLGAVVVVFGGVVVFIGIRAVNFSRLRVSLDNLTMSYRVSCRVI